MVGPFEIWRSIALFDYCFYSKEAIDEGIALVVSLDRLLFMRVIAMEVEKYRKDLKLIKDYYYRKYNNQDFLKNYEKHKLTYAKNNGAVFGENYLD